MSLRVGNRSLPRVPSTLNRRAPTKAVSQLVTKKQVRDMIKSAKDDQELKYKDVDVIGTGVNDIGVITDLCSVAQAVNVNSRIGDIIEIKSLEFRLTLTIGDTTNVGRIIIFQWFQLVAPVAGNILQNSGTDYVTSQYAGQLPESYAILFDSGPFALSSAFPIKCITQKFTHFKKRYIEFNPTFTTGINKLYAFFVTDSTVVPTPLISFESRLWFVDD